VPVSPISGWCVARAQDLANAAWRLRRDRRALRQSLAIGAPPGKTARPARLARPAWPSVTPKCNWTRPPRCQAAGSEMRLIWRIAKGYAVDQALKCLSRLGIASALVSGGGDMAVSGPPPGKQGWRIELPPWTPATRPGALCHVDAGGHFHLGRPVPTAEINGVVTRISSIRNGVGDITVWSR